MKFFLLFLGLSLASAAVGQDSWKVVLNSKTLLHTSAEDEQKNVRKLKKAQLNGKGNLTVTYTEQQKKKDWERSILIYDPSDNLLLEQKGSRLLVRNASLLGLFKKSATLRIYTTSLPTDPKMKEQVRVRRVHLCTLSLL